MQVGADKNMTKLYYDVGEIGWSMYLAAHIRFLYQRGTPAAVACNGAKKVFYRGTANEILSIPDEWLKKFGEFPSDGGHLYNPKTRRRIKDHNLLAEPFKIAYPEYDIVTSYGTFPEQRTFLPYNHSGEAEDFCRKTFHGKQVIMIFPRCRGSKFKGRNIPGTQWERIAASLCDQFPENIVATFGSRKGSYTNLQVNKSNFMNLAGKNDSVSLDWMVALCNLKLARAAVGNQSGTVKMTLLCGTPTFIFGHEEKRHTVDENWADTRVAFHKVGPVIPWDRKASLFGYRVRNLSGLIEEISAFITQ